MPIPLVTTTVSVYGRRPQSLNDPDAEGYDPPEDPYELRATNINASITAPAAVANAPQQVETYAFRCDVTDINRFDVVVDESTGDTWEIQEIRESIVVDYGLEHMVGTVIRVKGLSNVGL